MANIHIQNKSLDCSLPGLSSNQFFRESDCEPRRLHEERTHIINRNAAHSVTNGTSSVTLDQGNDNCASIVSMNNSIPEALNQNEPDNTIQQQYITKHRQLRWKNLLGKLKKDKRSSQQLNTSSASLDSVDSGACVLEQDIDTCMYLEENLRNLAVEEGGQHHQQMFNTKDNSCERRDVPSYVHNDENETKYFDTENARAMNMLPDNNRYSSILNEGGESILLSLLLPILIPFGIVYGLVSALSNLRTVNNNNGSFRPFGKGTPMVPAVLMPIILPFMIIYGILKGIIAPFDFVQNLFKKFKKS